jgi:hypothetical protein
VESISGNPLVNKTSSTSALANDSAASAINIATSNIPSPSAPPPIQNPPPFSLLPPVNVSALTRAHAIKRWRAHIPQPPGTPEPDGSWRNECPCGNQAPCQDHPELKTRVRYYKPQHPDYLVGLKEFGVPFYKPTAEEIGCTQAALEKSCDFFASNPRMKDLPFSLRRRFSELGFGFRGLGLVAPGHAVAKRFVSCCHSIKGTDCVLS